MDFKLFREWARKVFPQMTHEEIRRRWVSYHMKELRAERFKMGRLPNP